MNAYTKKFQVIASNLYCKGFKTKLVRSQHILCYIVHWEKKRELKPLFRYNNKILIDS